jgi:hypothetical protein
MNFYKKVKLNFEIKLDRQLALVVAGPGWEKLEQRWLG